MSGRYQRAFPAMISALPDFEFLVTERVEMGRLATLNDGAGGFSVFNRRVKLETQSDAPFDFDEDALGGIDDPAFETQFRCQPVNERSKPDALDGAANDDSHALATHRCSRGRCPRFHLTKRPST